jgi:hypothetical protein
VPSQCSLTQNGLKQLPGFPYNFLPVSCGDIGFKKHTVGQVLAWESGHKVPLLPSCPLQTILLSDLVGRGILLQIVMTVWCTF